MRLNFVRRWDDNEAERPREVKVERGSVRAALEGIGPIVGSASDACGMAEDGL